jgi:transcriptional regulator with XRE-family HTH domain
MVMDTKSLGSYLRYVRVKRGVERKDLADDLRISYAHLNNIELGDRPPSIDLIIDLARVLKIEPGVLLNVLSGWCSLEQAKEEFDHDKTFSYGNDKAMELHGTTLIIPENLETGDVERIVDYVEVLVNNRQYLKNKNIDSSGNKIKLQGKPEISPASYEASAVTLHRQKEQAEARKRKSVQDIQTSYSNQDHPD